MKKALAFIAVALVAIASQAATINWNSGVLYLAEDKEGGLSSTKGKAGVAYEYYIVSAAQATTLAAMDDAGRIAWAAENGGGIAAADKTSGTSKSTTSKANWEWTNGADATEYTILAIYTSDTAANGDTAPFTMTGLLKASTTDTGASTPSSDITAGLKWTGISTPVPEPCAVALVALGLAAFGLKRKVA